VTKVLAPLEPRDIICIGLNYRKHAMEGNLPIPEFPVVFMKNSGALQNPNDPIVLPRFPPEIAGNRESPDRARGGRQEAQTSWSGGGSLIIRGNWSALPLCL
jgi:hypothetical protein